MLAVAEEGGFLFDWFFCGAVIFLNKCFRERERDREHCCRSCFMHILPFHFIEFFVLINEDCALFSADGSIGGMKLRNIRLPNVETIPENSVNVLKTNCKIMSPNNTKKKCFHVRNHYFLLDLIPREILQRKTLFLKFTAYKIKSGSPHRLCRKQGAARAY